MQVNIIEEKIMIKSVTATLNTEKQMKKITYTNYPDKECNCNTKHRKANEKNNIHNRLDYSTRNSI
jgi:hypothetical protein